MQVLGVIMISRGTYEETEGKKQRRRVMNNLLLSSGLELMLRCHFISRHFHSPPLGVLCIPSWDGM